MRKMKGTGYECLNAPSVYLEISSLGPEAFNNTYLGNSLETVISSGASKNEKGLLERVFSDKRKNLKATIKSLSDEIKLREDISRYLIDQVEEDMSCDIVICAPDNDETRIFVSRHFCGEVPVIFTGLDLHANTGYVFIQESGKACIGCALPNAVSNKIKPCPNSPAVIDLVKIISGLILFSVDSTVMERKRNWNFRQFFLGGFVPEIVKTVDRKESCPLCKGPDS